MGETVFIHAACSPHERLPAFVRIVGELASSSESVSLQRRTRGDGEDYDGECSLAELAQLVEREYRPASRLDAAFVCVLASGRRAGMWVEFSDDEWAWLSQGRIRGDVDRDVYNRRSGVRPRYAPWQEFAEAAVAERDVRENTRALLASYDRALGTGGNGVVTMAWEFAADTNAAAFAARFRSPELLLEACAASATMSTERSEALRRQDPAQVRAALAALAVPDEHELALDDIVARARQLLAVAEQTDVVDINWSKRDQYLPLAAPWKVALEEGGSSTVVCRPRDSMAAFYEVFADFLLTT